MSRPWFSRTVDAVERVLARFYPGVERAELHPRVLATYFKERWHHTDPSWFRGPDAQIPLYVNRRLLRGEVSVYFEDGDHVVADLFP